jgi:hypothetical protein
MRVLVPLTALVATVAALSSPHRKATKKASVANHIQKRDTHSVDQADYQYLNKKTQRKKPY